MIIVTAHILLIAFIRGVYLNNREYDIIEK